MNHIYLDANSTTRLDPRVAQAMQICHAQQYVNPASQHQLGQKARKKLEQARHQVANHIGLPAESGRLIFTSGGTEANNLAIIGLSGEPPISPNDEPPELVISSIEHPSVIGAANYLAGLGFRVLHIPVDQFGVVQVQQLSHLLGPKTRLVSLMLANNETGVIQPVEKAARICTEANVPLHVDAVQAIGKIPVDFASLGCSAMTISAHKLHGPRGIGALGMHADLPLRPILFGGFQQWGQRPGTEDVALCVGFGKACQISAESLDQRTQQMQHLRDFFEAEIRSALAGVVINGAAVNRVPHTSNISFCSQNGLADIDRQALLMAADMAGVAISTGSACASGSSEPSPVLQAMGLNRDLIESSIRVSFGADTTLAETELAATRIINAVNHLRQLKTV